MNANTTNHAGKPGLRAESRLLTPLDCSDYHAYMDAQFIIEEHPADPEWTRIVALAERNLLWFDEHAIELEVFSRYRGRYVAASGGELFVADTPEEIDRLTHEKHPDDVPHVRYIPREKAYRIYACQRAMASL